MTWAEEVEKIKVASVRYGVDYHFMMALRKQENGSEGREFGVLSVSAPTYDDQLRVACASVKHRLLQYEKNPLFGYTAPNGDIVVVYHPGWIDWFSTIWAPIGADNDPHGLNRNWASGVKYYYLHFLDAEHQRVSNPSA